MRGTISCHVLALNKAYFSTDSLRGETGEARFPSVVEDPMEGEALEEDPSEVACMDVLNRTPPMVGRVSEGDENGPEGCE